MDHTIWCQSNKGDYEVSVVARLKGPLVSNVQYILRVKDPDNNTIDYMTTLEGFKELGQLFQALHHFCRRPIYANEKDAAKLKKLLTAENIKNFVELMKLSEPEKRNRATD